MDVGLPRVPQRGPRIERQIAVSMAVSYSDARVEDYSLPNGTVVAVPQCSSGHAKLSWRDLQFFPGNVKNNWNRCRKVGLSVGTVKSDALQVARGYLKMIKEPLMKTSEVE